MAADLLSIGYLLEADTLHTANAGRILIVLDPLDERSGTLLNPSIFWYRSFSDSGLSGGTFFAASFLKCRN